MKVIGISANGLEEHKDWVKDINSYGAKVGPTDVQFPIVSLSWFASDPRPRDCFFFFRSLTPIGKSRLCMICWMSKMRPTVMQRDSLLP